jgi:hypothetical protein
MALIDFVIPHGAHDPMDLLKADHEKARALLEAIQDTGDRARVKRQKLFAELRRLRTAHQKAEEAVLYRAAAAKRKALADIVQEGLQEHHVADVLIRELGRMDVATPQWKAKAHVLGEGIRHHFKEEEHTMFPKARLAFTRAELTVLGKRLAQRRAALLARASAAAPAGRTKTTAQRTPTKAAKPRRRAKAAATAAPRSALRGGRRATAGRSSAKVRNKAKAQMAAKR